jgi:hypothetical protein
MSHTPSISRQTDIEHITMARSRFEGLLKELEADAHQAGSGDTRAAIASLAEIASSGERLARRLEAVLKSNDASQLSH